MTPEDARHHARAHALASKRFPSAGPRSNALTDIAAGYEALAKELEAEAKQNSSMVIYGGKSYRRVVKLVEMP